MDFDLRDIAEKKKAKEAAAFEPSQVVIQGVIVAKEGSVYAGSKNQVWVRTQDGLTSALLPLGSETKPVAGTPVRLARDPKPSDPLKITSLNSDGSSAYASGNTTQQNPHWYSAHYMNGQVIGSDAGLVHPRMLEPCRLTPLGGYLVGVSPFINYANGVRSPISGVSFDLLGDKPIGLNESRWVTIYLDVAAKTYGKAVGAIYTDPLKATFPNVPDGALVVGSVPMSQSMTEIVEIGIEDGKVPFFLPAKPQQIPLDPNVDNWTDLVNGEILWFDAANGYFTTMGLTESPQTGQVTAWDGSRWYPASITDIEDSMAKTILSAPIDTTTSGGLIAATTGKRVAIVGLLVTEAGPMKVKFKQTPSNTAITGDMDLSVKGNGFEMGNWKDAFHTTANDQGVAIELSASAYTVAGAPFKVAGIISYYLVDNI